MTSKTVYYILGPKTHPQVPRYLTIKFRYMGPRSPTNYVVCAWITLILIILRYSNCTKTIMKSMKKYLSKEIWSLHLYSILLIQHCFPQSATYSISILCSAEFSFLRYILHRDNNRVSKVIYLLCLDFCVSETVLGSWIPWRSSCVLISSTNSEEAGGLSGLGSVRAENQRTK